MSTARDRADAQRRVNRIRAFRAELDALDAAGVSSLTPEQREQIARYHDEMLRQLSVEHDIDRTEAAGQLSRGMRIASFIAAVALTAAVYSLVARFWGWLDLPLQATLLCAFPLIALIGVELSAQRERTLYIASIFALVAFGTYWLSVLVLSDLLNLPMAPPALWGGALFGVALALPYGFRVIFAGALIALLTALSGTVFHAGGVPWTELFQFPEVVTASALMLFVLASRVSAGRHTFASVTRGVSAGTLCLGLLFLSVAGPASLLRVPSRTSELIYQAALLVMTPLLLVIGLRRQWLETVYIAAATLTLFIFTRFVDWFWDLMPRFVFFLLLAAVAFGWLLALRRMRARLSASGMA